MKIIYGVNNETNSSWYSVMAMNKQKLNRLHVMTEQLRDECCKKLEKLNRFRCQDFHMLDKTEWYLMKNQQNVMHEYIDILNARIAHAVLKE